MKKEVYYFFLPFVIIWIALPSFSQNLCDGTLSTNILSNGDFGSGQVNNLPNDPGLAPGYNYVSGPPISDGSYMITNNTSPYGGNALAAYWRQ